MATNELDTRKVEEFLRKLASDSNFRHSLEEAGDTDRKRQILDQNGFSGLSRSAIEAKLSQGGSELSDADLELVAGGTSASWVAVSIAAVALALL